MFRYAKSIINGAYSQVQSVINYNALRRGVHFSAIHFCENSEENNENEKKKPIKEGADRSRNIPVEISIKYLKSEAYKTTYGDSKY